MLHLKILHVLLLSFAFAEAQNINQLEQVNGFKDIKLGLAIDSIKGEKKLKKEFKEQGEFLARLYTVEHPDYKQIGEVSVSNIELSTYKDLVYQIHVVTEKDPRLMKALESIYGKAEYNPLSETYFWKNSHLVLKFRSYSKRKLEIIYISYPLLSMMKKDKEKKVSNIADDF